MNDNNETNMYKKFIAYVTSTQFLILGLFIVGAIFFFAGAYIGQKVFGSNPPDLYWSIVFSVSLLWQIGSAILSIVHREIPRPGLPSVKGVWAVIFSSLALAILLLGEIFFIYSIIIELNG